MQIRNLRNTKQWCKRGQDRGVHFEEALLVQISADLLQDAAALDEGKDGQYQQPDHLAGHCKAAGREQHRLWSCLLYTSLQCFWKIKWPAIMPTTLYILVITTINSFQCFALIPVSYTHLRLII